MQNLLFAVIATVAAAAAFPAMAADFDTQKSADRDAYTF
jgi:hypothetical protein